MPHSFSRSPVEEVFCQCTFGSAAESLSLVVPPPYRGWPHIRDEIRTMIASAGDISRITGCNLRYTDLIPVASGMDMPGTEAIVDLLSGKFDCHIDMTKNEIVLGSTDIPGTAGSVCLREKRHRKPAWTLIFSLHTVGETSFDSCDSVIGWFDDARAEIHDLFDLIVPEEIVQIFR